MLADPGRHLAQRVVQRHLRAVSKNSRQLRVRRVHVSLSHHEGFAAAVVVVEGTRKRSRVPSDAW